MAQLELNSKERIFFPDVKLVYFDVGGVLFRFKGGLQDIAEKVGLPYENCEQIWLEMDDSICRGETPPQNLWTRIKLASGYRGDDIDFIPFWVNHFQTILETHQLVHDLCRSRGVGLLTNIYPGVYEQALKKGNIPNIPYASVIKSCEIRKIKPDPAIYKLAQQKGGVKPEEILFIDDSLRFVTPALEMGWNTFVFNGESAFECVGKLRQSLGL